MLTYADDGTLVSEQPLSSVKASELLGVNRRDLHHHINVINEAIRAPNLDNRLVNVLDPEREMRPGPPRPTPYDRLPYADTTPTGLYPDNIPGNAIFVYKEGANELFDVYKTPSDVARDLGLPYYMVTRNINKAFYVAVGAGAMITMINHKFAF